MVEASKTEEQAPKIEEPGLKAPGRYRELSRPWYVLLVAFSLAAMTLAILQIFLLKPFGFFLIDTGYLYCLIGFYTGIVFIIFPASKSEPRDKIPARDYIFFVLLVGISFYYASHAIDIVEGGWEFLAPTHIMILGIIVWFLVIEAVRRTSGLPLAMVCLFFSLYPLFAVHMPAFLEGIPFSFADTARYHALSCESILGIPMKVVGKLLVGFMLFGVALMHTGGGKFFLNLASALVGFTRGGPAKIAVIASGLFGSMSGSVISNVITTGSVTIPAMKKTGYEPAYAAAIEACASTGGTLMPPIMGAAAFIMASLLDIPYLIIAASAAIPSILYYFGLLVQVDAHAAKRGIKGLSKEECPSILETLKEGWFYLFAFAALIYFLIVLWNEAQAPFYAMAILLICAMIRKETRFTGKSFLEFIASTGRFMAEIATILAAVGLVVGSLAMTGVAHSFSHELVAFARGMWLPMLFMGALASFILGMGMTVTACYVFLAIVLAPALVAIGLHPLSVHLFVMYWGMASFITPPVALAAITAAPIAGSEPMKTGFLSMRLGAVKYFIPFFFVLNPALVLHSSVTDIVTCSLTAIIGVYFLGAAIEGYILGIGEVSRFSRIACGIGGVLLMMPYSPLVPGASLTDAIGGAVIGLLIAHHLLAKRRASTVTRL